MKVYCNRELLQKNIASADRITGKNLSLPILNTVLIVAEQKELVIRSTNLEVGVEFRVPASVEVKGSIALPGSLLANTLAVIQDEEDIALSVEQGVSTIKTKSKTLTVKGFSPDDFPTIPIIQDGDSFTISVEDFIQGVKSVVMSSSQSEVKPEISSVYIHQKEHDSITFVATDGFRLSEKTIKEGKITLSQGVIIPIKNIQEIIRLFDGIEGDMQVVVSKNQISFTGENFYITSRVIQGIYPDYGQIIPKGNTTEVILIKEDLLNALKLSSFFADKFNNVVFLIDPQQKIFSITTKNNDIGEIVSHIPSTLNGESITITLNGRHISDVLSVIQRDSVSLGFNGSDKAVVVKGLGDESFTYLSMPLNRI